MCVTCSVIGAEWELYVVSRECDHPPFFRQNRNRHPQGLRLTLNGPRRRGRFGLTYFPAGRVVPTEAAV